MKIIGKNIDLLESSADGIGNAWNRNIIPWWLLLPQGVSGAIKKTAGYRVFNELGYKPLPLGEVRLTSAGKLSNRFKGIIHVAGINMLWRSSEKSVKSSVSNALLLAQSQGWQSLAFPIIGAGSGGMKLDRALGYMLESAHSMNLKLDSMYICLWGKPVEKYGIDCLLEIINAM